MSESPWHEDADGFLKCRKHGEVVTDIGVDCPSCHEEMGKKAELAEKERDDYHKKAIDLADYRDRLISEKDEIQKTLETVEMEVAKVYCHITGGRMSKCNYEAGAVISEADAETDRIVQEELNHMRQMAGRLAEELRCLYENIVWYQDDPVSRESPDAKQLRDVKEALKSWDAIKGDRE